MAACIESARGYQAVNIANDSTLHGERIGTLNIGCSDIAHHKVIDEEYQATHYSSCKTAEIDIQHSRWKYNRDFALGDIVTTQDDALGKYVNVRLREVLEVQDENGYSVEANNQT